MKEQELQDEIRKLIAQNKTESAFEMLSSIQFTNVDKEYFTCIFKKLKNICCLLVFSTIRLKIFLES